MKRQEVITNKTVQAIAEVHNATAAQIALAWLIAQDALPIPKAVGKQHIDENVLSVDMQLSKDDMERLSNP